MAAPIYDVIAIGNAIVDILSQAEDDFIVEQGMTKGSMALMFSPAEADALYAKMGPGREISGGSAANTVAGHRRARRQVRLHRPGRRRPARRGLRARHPGRGGRFRHSGACRRSEHRALPDLRHARRAADDEHLPRRLAVPSRERARRGCDRGRIDPLSRRLSVGPRGAARRDAQGDRHRPRARPQGRFHAFGRLLHLAPRRRFPPAHRRGADRHPLRQRERAARAVRA